MYKIIHVYDFNALGIFWKVIGAKLEKHQVQVTGVAPNDHILGK